MYNHQLDTFLKVAELGSFGKAAEALYISVPAAIQQVRVCFKTQHLCAKRQCSKLRT